MISTCLAYQEAFLRLFYPAVCGVCTRLLELREKHLCPTCRAALEQLRFSPAEAIQPERFRNLEQAWALYPYESPLKEIMASVKFLKKRWLVDVFRNDLRDFAAMIRAENDYRAVIPVPLDYGRRLSREFNQSELIARLLQPVLGRPVDTRSLYKRHVTLSQNRLSREERETNLYGAFAVRNPAKIRGGSFLLVDDIITTGATAEEAARTLKKYGAGRIDFFALARTLPPAGRKD